MGKPAPGERKVSTWSRSVMMVRWRTGPTAGLASHGAYSHDGVCEDEYKRTNCLFPPGRIVGLNRDKFMSSNIQEELRVELLLVYTKRNQLRSLEHLVRMLSGDLPGEVSWRDVAIADRPDMTCLSGLYFTSVLKQDRQADLLQLLPL